MTRKILGARLRKLRKAQGKSLRAVDRIAGYQGACRGLESGERYPSIELLLKLAQGLGVQPSYFVD